MDAPGYLSEQSKKTFTLTAGILGAAFFVLQFIVPFAVMFAIMPTMMFNDSMFRFTNVDEGELWNGDLWYLERRGGFDPKSNGARLARLPLDAEEPESERLAEVTLRDARLLPDGDRLWLLAADGVAVYEDGALRAEDAEVLGSISRPFLLDGAPAVIERTPSGSRVRTYDDGAWQIGPDVVVPGTDPKRGCCPGVMVWAWGDELHTFVRDEGTVYRTGAVQDPVYRQRNASRQAAPGPGASGSSGPQRRRG